MKILFVWGFGRIQLYNICTTPVQTIYTNVTTQLHAKLYKLYGTMQIYITQHTVNKTVKPYTALYILIKPYKAL